MKYYALTVLTAVMSVEADDSESAISKILGVDGVDSIAALVEGPDLVAYLKQGGYLAEDSEDAQAVMDAIESMVADGQTLPESGQVH